MMNREDKRVKKISPLINTKYVSIYEEKTCANEIKRLLGNTALKYPPRRLRALIDSQLRLAKSNTYLWIGNQKVDKDIVITRGENNRIYDLRRLRSDVINIINESKNKI